MDVMSKLDEQSIQYNRSCYLHKQVRTQVLEGWFDAMQEDKIFVGVLDNIPVIAEELVYVEHDWKVWCLPIVPGIPW
ncbi:hypothetical protein MTO96_036412 [Rhipicephalus appendiculatus]